MKCGLGVVDWRSGATVATFMFLESVEEIFDVQVLPTVRCPMVRGPLPPGEHNDEIWVAPPPPAELA